MYFNFSNNEVSKHHIIALYGMAYLPVVAGVRFGVVGNMLTPR